MMLPCRLYIILLLIILISNCKKDPETPSDGNKFEYGQTSVDSVSYFQLIISTSIKGLGGNTVLQHGHCFDTASMPDINDSITVFSGNPQNYKITSVIQNLEPARKYFVRAYCKLSNTTVYSEETEITTLKTGKPVVSTLAISDITISSARCEGIVTADSGLAVTEKGVCWDTVNIFDVATGLGKMIGGTGTGPYTCQLNQLIEGRNYFIKTYAINEAGTAYGELLNFQTTPVTIPEVVTAEVTLVTINSAQCGGEVISSGSGTVTQRGICWGSNPGVSLGNCLGSTQQGSGIGTFTSPMTGLQDGIFYYVNAYAINEKGTAYGEERSFQTVSINLPTVTTAEVTNVTSTSAQCGGNVVNAGNGSVSVRGVCWGLNSDVTLQNCINFTSNGSGTGSFTSNVTGLSAGNTYYVRAYATNENGTGYGATQNINTPSVPALTTTEVTSITTTSAISGGNVTFNGFGAVSGRGVCWGSSPNPTIGNCLGLTNNGSGTGSFTSQITGLSPSTMYYVRAYATNETGTGYGGLKSFITAAIGVPTVITANITNITTTSATGGGNVTDNGAGTVLSRGVCWGTQPNPTLGNALGFTNNGSGNGIYVSQITGLTQGTLYYVRAYATNEAGTGYGDLKSFNTLTISVPVVSTTEVTNITTTTAQCGGNVTSGGNGTVSARGVCWGTSLNPSLTNNLGFTTNGSGLGSYTSNITGLTLGTTYHVRAYATNEAGTSYGEDREFTTASIAIPTVTTAPVINITTNSAESGGEVTNAGNGNVSARGVCWSTSLNPTITNNLGFTTDGSGLGTFTSIMSGLSLGTTYHVRAYATNEAGTGYGIDREFTTTSIVLATVITAPVTNITTNSAESGGEVTDAGNGNVSARGVCWNTSPEPTLTNNLGYTMDGSGTGTFTSLMTGLADTTLFYLRAYATNEAGTNYGNEEDFTTLDDPCDGDTTIIYEGQVYGIIAIGDQCWMSENLNVGIMISNTAEPSDNGIFEKYCYYNNISNCDIYGGLYKWAEMMNYSSIPGSQGICPNGWHIAQDDEWKILEGYADSQYGIGDPIWDQLDSRGYDAGKNLKSTTGWLVGGTDLYGFNLLPGGYTVDQNNFMDFGEYANLWTSTSTSSSYAFHRWFVRYSDQIERNPDYKLYALSIRCIKN